MTDPKDLTVDEVEEFVADIGDVDRLEGLRQAERMDGDGGRVTALRAIDDRIEELEDSDEDEGEAEDALDAAKDVLENREAEEAAEEAEYARITVKNPGGRGRHVAGYSFEPHEAKTIPNSPAVKTALRNGNLQFVRNR